MLVIISITIIYCWKFKQPKNALPKLVSKSLRNQGPKRCAAGAQEVSVKKHWPKEGTQNYLIESCWPILPVHTRKKPCLKCVWATGSGSPWSLPGHEADNESLYLLPQKTQVLRNMMNQIPRESWNSGWPSKSTCVVIKGWSKVQMVGKFLPQVSIPIGGLPTSRNTVVPVCYCRNTQNCLTGRKFITLSFK